MALLTPSQVFTPNGQNLGDSLCSLNKILRILHLLSPPCNRSWPTVPFPDYPSNTLTSLFLDLPPPNQLALCPSMGILSRSALSHGRHYQPDVAAECFKCDQCHTVRYHFSYKSKETLAKLMSIYLTQYS